MDKGATAQPLCKYYGPLIKFIAGLHNNCIHSVASLCWCQITPVTKSYNPE